VRGVTGTRPWWTGSVGYEVYIRSFADGDGDGIGDFHGLTDRLDHLAWLGVEIVWVTPFYPSPQADFGYDVADYCDVDPAFGDLDAFDRFVVRAHELGLRVVIDLVPNHSSDRHPWFAASRRSPNDPKRDWYVWRDPAPDGGPPNNWVSHFGGPAWTLDPSTGQYYLHLFLPEQPDLNWRNPEVRDAFDDVLRFWLQRGVDGFRIDVAHGLLKTPGFPDNPVRTPVTPGMSPRTAFRAFEHRYDLDQPEVLDVYRRWRRITDEYDAFLIGEVYLRDADPSRVARYVLTGDGLHTTFWFPTLHVGWDPDAIWGAIERMSGIVGDKVCWPISSHDDPRAPTRFGGGDLGRERALAYLVLLCGLPGNAFLYQGAELGLEDVAVPPERRRDPVATRNSDPSDGRDGCRTPMPWEPGLHLGFSAAEPWLPMDGHGPSDTVAVQREDPSSILSRTRELLRVHADLPDLHGAPLVWLTRPPDPVLAVLRGETLVAVHVGDRRVGMRLPAGEWEIVYDRAGRPPPPPVTSVLPLEPVDALILRRV
jgi:alpha-glucosidase